ncbi:MAG: RNA polymerase sigma factor [Candidatus Krumholzibacteriota bacterium]|nr:RNA polymerase sigma factor [Candidatus Krumholzibacteriota bacterium]
MKVLSMAERGWPADRPLDREEARRLFPHWVRQSRNSIYATLVRILRDESEAEDLLQETYLRALDRLGSYRGEGEPEAWLRRIAVRLALNHLRARRVRRWLPLPGGSRETVDPTTLPDSAAPPDETAAGGERRRRLEILLRKQPPRARVAFTLRHLEGRSYAEIASLIGGAEATARSIVFRTASRLEREIRQRGWSDEATD